MTRAITCPRCGQEITADTEGNLASGVVEHAARTHDHELSLEHILGTIRGEDPAGRHRRGRHPWCGPRRHPHPAVAVDAHDSGVPSSPHIVQ